MDGSCRFSHTIIKDKVLIWQKLNVDCNLYLFCVCRCPHALSFSEEFAIMTTALILMCGLLSQLLFVKISVEAIVLEDRRCSKRKV